MRQGGLDMHLYSRMMGIDLSYNKRLELLPSHCTPPHTSEAAHPCLSRLKTHVVTNRKPDHLLHGHLRLSINKIEHHCYIGL